MRLVVWWICPLKKTISLITRIEGIHNPSVTLLITLNGICMYLCGIGNQDRVWYLFYLKKIHRKTPSKTNEFSLSFWLVCPGFFASRSNATCHSLARPHAIIAPVQLISSTFWEAWLTTVGWRPIRKLNASNTLKLLQLFQDLIFRVQHVHD